MTAVESLCPAVEVLSFFFLRPNSLLKAPRRVDFFRWGLSLLAPDCSVASLKLECLMVLGGTVLRCD